MVIKKTITDREGQRLDNYLFTVYPATPNAHIYRMIRKGRIRINDKTCKDNKRRLGFGDVLSMPSPINPKKPIPSQGTIDKVMSMIQEDNDDFWVLNKAQGFCVHQSDRDTFGIIEVMQHVFEEAHLIHRLDRNTSGCLLIAKTYPVLLAFQRIWREHKVKKMYQLLSQGSWSYQDIYTVSKPLLRLNDDSNQVIVSDKGKEATTHFKKIKQYNDYVLLEASIETGRTHQIRVHAASIQHPIVGDARYGRKNSLVEYMFLHAASLAFDWKNSHKVVTCGMSDEQRKCLEDLN